MDFLFHKISDKERGEIEKQAKKILDDFSKQLSAIKKEIGESMIEREVCERVEGSGSLDNFSREIMFDNAPEKNDNFILGEKKGW